MNVSCTHVRYAPRSASRRSYQDIHIDSDTVFPRSVGAQALGHERKRSGGEGIHVRDAVGAAGFYSENAFDATCDGKTDVPRCIAITVTGGSGRARLSQSPIGPEAISNEARPDERVPFSRRTKTAQQ